MTVKSSLDRRDFLHCAAVICAGGIVPRESLALSEEQHKFVQANQNFLDRHSASLFSLDQRQTVAAVARQIIPTTDTPGADEAEVGQFIELMVQHWFTEQERVDFLAGLKQLMVSSDGPFHSLVDEMQIEILEALEDEASDATWFNLGSTMRTWDSEAPFICQIKELSVLGFMLSEVGGTEFLRPNPMGQFDGEVKVNSDSPAHAPQIPIRVLSKSLS